MTSSPSLYARTAGSLRRMVGALNRCWHVWLAVVVCGLIGMWLAWIYVRHGEDAFHEALGRMVSGEWEERPNDEVSDRRAHGNENTTGANGGSLH